MTLPSLCWGGRVSALPGAVYASILMSSSLLVIGDAMRVAVSPACIGLSSVPMSRYTIRMLWYAEREYFLFAPPLRCAG